MDELFHIDQPSCHGYRLHKLEIYNWGTFDSTRGNIHTVRPAGTTALLIGQNGSGKSTIVDALLTLLVRPVVRNYNVAAGAHKQERDERTYIKGAYGRLGRDEDNRAEVQYLRPDGRHYASLLACFRNDRNEAFTLAQILYLNSDGHTDKVYCFSPGERSIAKDCSNLISTERVKQQMEKRGFRATTTYTEYNNWFTRSTGIRPKAMDMFNQTVAVKDIQSLNKFIREHMLESKPWNEKIESLQNHFIQLSEAHQSLVRVRRQFELLTPLAKKGEIYLRDAEKLQKMEQLLEASDSFFRQKTVILLEPECERVRVESRQLMDKKDQLDHDIAESLEEQRRLRNEMEQVGGERLKQIPLLIETCQSHFNTKRAANQRFHTELAAIGLREPIVNHAMMQQLHVQLPQLAEEINQKINTIEKNRENKVIERADFNHRMEEDKRELAALAQHQGNLPHAFADVRRQIYEHLRLPEKDLPFVAELIAVKPEEREWEPSIEMVLRGFALSLLVPQRFYHLVSQHVDHTRLADDSGQGRRLVYLRVGERLPISGVSGPVVHANSLIRKLAFRDGHPLLPWVRAELEERFNFICCNTVEEFQNAGSLAMTRQRHVKMRGGRHEKDDREFTTDRRNFVLGWDNKSKRLHLASEVQRLGQVIEKLTGEIRSMDVESERLRSRKTALARARETTDYAAIDFATHEREIKALLAEKESLEQNNNVIRVLKERLKGLEDHVKSRRELRDAIVGQKAVLENRLHEWESTIKDAKALLSQQERTGELTKYAECFADCEVFFTDTPLVASTMAAQEQAFLKARRDDIAALKTTIDPLENELCALMNRYLREFTDEQADLDANIESLDSFRSLLDHIRRDDLPRHEARFKERLNEKVIQEIGLLNGAFQTERTEISTKINLLNQSLRQLEYRLGTFMQLEPRPVRDREIKDFQDSLRECLAGTFEGTLEADEARYIRIAKLLARLRDEERWREKVTDVRRWFDFAARELDEATGQEKAYYEDSTGQSGGEKAKLAFTILVAAIAYQYDIDPGRPASDRFHFVVVDEMFSKVDDQYAEYALELFKKFGLQLLIVAPLDAKARVTEPYVGCYLHVVKDSNSNLSEIYTMTAREFEDAVIGSTAEVTNNSDQGKP